MKPLPALLAALLLAAPVVGAAASSAPSPAVGDPSPAAPAPTREVDASAPAAGVGAGATAPAVGAPASTVAPASAAGAGSTVGAAAAGVRRDAASNPTAGNGTSVLAIPEDAVARTDVRRHRVDLGPSVGFAAAATETRLATLTAVERVRSAATDAERKQRILGELNRIEQRAIGLQDRQGRLVARYGRGDLETRAFLVALARVDAEARELERRRARLADLAAATPEFSLDPARLAALERELKTVTGPLRERAAAVLRGRAAPGRFYVEVGPDSVVLATIADGSYLREAYRGPVRNRTGASIDPERALATVAAGYPTIWETRLTRENTTSVTGSGASFLVRVPHRRGVLFASVDSGSRRVFKEFQRRPLPTVDGERVARVKDGLRLTVNRTYPGGPLEIRLVEADTGTPVDANVTLGQGDGRSDLIGRTGADGRVWTLSPRGQFTVTAIRGNAAVVVTVRPRPTPGLAPGG